MNATLYKNRAAESDIAPYRIVAFGSADHSVVQADDSTAPLAGVNERLAIASGERADIILAGIAEVEYGGTVHVGLPLTTDSDGKAVEAAPGDYVIGNAQVAGASGDIGEVLIAPSVMPPAPA